MTTTQQTKKITLEFDPGYFKRGDDVAGCLENSKKESEDGKPNSLHALSDYCDLLDDASNRVSDLNHALRNTVGVDFELHGDTHYTAITVSRETAEKLKATAASETLYYNGYNDSQVLLRDLDLDDESIYNTDDE